ncbi:hypothetical protein C772_03104 [Bhargavaea cecembensis DSE10]|uniref:DUF1541 domain-containing protein n=1 Tax=Bhargavaea cecembensis DSE10 TaxID=1235279 RepID=M7N8M3_9BACL|nr:YdhK family protein [Bhargavaea cecembensis]EMR04953.1 hypothetical protein C772_03104 [Bhargavaea cecembensis DSE10]
MTFRKTLFPAGALILLLTACGANDGQENAQPEDPTSQEQQYDRDESNDPYEMHDSEDMSDMHKMHGGSGEVPEGLTDAPDPKFPVGSEVMMHADHMPGMDGVRATVAGAYDTTAYSVTYTPADGGKPVKDHKWVIHEEIQDPGKAPLDEGIAVTLNAVHMPGMQDAEAIIESAEETTVYMVDFVSAESGEKVKNHKWVTEDELSEAE